MTLGEALKVNPYDPTKGNEAAYVRYLRYNVDGFYNLDSSEVMERWKKMAGTKEGGSLAGGILYHILRGNEMH